MKRHLTTLLICFIVTGCAMLGTPPEQQIRDGANSLTSATNLAIGLYQRDRMTAAQAKAYRGMLGTASDALDVTAADLAACRAMTGSTQTTNPDPCKQNVATDLNLVTSVLNQLEATMKAKEAEAVKAQGAKPK